MNQAYPRLLRRVQALSIDGIVIPVTAIATLVFLGQAGVDEPWIKWASVLFVIFALEPMIVSVTGGTIGHHLLKLRVRRAHADKRLNIFLATLRFLVKTLFGAPGFFVILISRKHQALHDFAAHSIVVYKTTIGLPGHEVLSERTSEDEGQVYASVGRRLLVIILYGILLLIIVSWAPTFFSSPRCWENNICSEAEDLLLAGLGLGYVVLLGVIAVLGWKGKLYGCRKVSKVNVA